MIRFVIAFALAALSVLAVLFLDARLVGVRADEADDCVEGKGDTKIQGCSRIIKSGRLRGKPISKKNIADVYTNRGRGYLDKGQYDRAIADHNKAIELAPKIAAYYFNRGLVYSDKDQPERAIADYDRAIELNPKYAKAYFYRGTAYDDMVEPERAGLDFGKAIEIDSNYVDAYISRGGVFFLMYFFADPDTANLRLAIADFDKAIKLDPKKSSAYNGRAEAYREIGEYDRAIADYNKALKLRPKWAMVYNSRGLAHKKNGQSDKAIADFRKAAKLDTTKYHYKGNLLQSLGASAATTNTAVSKKNGGKTTTSTNVSEDMEITFWNSVKDSGDPVMLQAYLDQFPKGTFAALAKIKLKKAQ